VLRATAARPGPVNWALVERLRGNRGHWGTDAIDGSQARELLCSHLQTS
jgi:hypothetical protein